MAIRVALRHVTEYLYDRPTTLGPQVVRLRPAPHCHTPVLSYSLQVEPAKQYLNWQQDPYGNYLARLQFHEPTREFRVTVGLIAELSALNPFEFFAEEYAELFPFAYDPELAKDLKPYLEPPPRGPRLVEYLREIDAAPRKTVDFLVDLNRKLQRDIGYLIRLEPGVQTAEETLAKRTGSCRDSALLMVHVLRAFGLAARFVSGYLIQLAPDEKPLEGPAGAERDFTDLHAWTEVYLPGAGWIGFDPTSGLLAGEGHLPLAATPAPQTAAPISGATSKTESTLRFEMSVARIHEPPRVTKPYSDEQWQAIDALGHAVDERLRQGDVRLTMGGEPTFVSIDEPDAPEWNFAAVGLGKQRLSATLIRRLRERFAPGGILHFGQGKWYPGESLPRWAYTCLWRADGEPIWSNPDLLAPIESRGAAGSAEAGTFVAEFADRLGVDGANMRPAYEDFWRVLEQESRLPVDVDPRDYDLADSEERRRLARVLERGVGEPVGYVLPLTRAWWQAKPRWLSGAWPLRSERLFLIPGDSPIGLRLPIDSLPATIAATPSALVDPFGDRVPLPSYIQFRHAARQRAAAADEPTNITGQQRPRVPLPPGAAAEPGPAVAAPALVRTALCVEPRNGLLHVFLPPADSLEDFLSLLAAVEETAEALKLPVVLEGYLPPPDSRLKLLKTTPDPGVIEVNVPPAADWRELSAIVAGVYEDARQTRLGTEKFQLDGKHAGTGGGNHIVLGGPTPADSPFLRRPDLLRSFLTYWNNHPALSFLFAGQFIGPTSQAPRIDEGRNDALYELELACAQLPERGPFPAWLVDRTFRHLLVDLTGNTHRAEFCIDKLYAPEHATGRLGLVELRAFEMPPHARMSLAQQLLVRACVAWFWERPCRDPLTRWGTALYDRFLLPHYMATDLKEVLNDLRAAGFAFRAEWFAPHVDFRCPPIGAAVYDGVTLELRTALEPWPVLGEEPGAGGVARYVDSSLERLEVKLAGAEPGRHAVLCNGQRVPLRPTGTFGEFVAGVRYRAWQPPSCLHPTIGVNTPLRFDVVDLRRRRSMGGCAYYVDHPGGVNSARLPINSLEAESRRASRFSLLAGTAGPLAVPETRPHGEAPGTLDLRLRS